MIISKIVSKIYKIIGSEYYLEINSAIFFTNWVFQKLFGNNKECPSPVHYTTLISGHKNIIYNKKSMSIKNSFALSGGCYFGIADGSTLEIGENTIWAWNVNIQTVNHDFLDREKYVLKSIKIGKNCWIGGNVSILPGVELGDNVTVGANSVVTKSFPSNVVIAGVPAKIIKEI